MQKFKSSQTTTLHQIITDEGLLSNSGGSGLKPSIYYRVLTCSPTTRMQSGTYTHSFVLEENEIVQVVVNNRDDGRHPFYLHGHYF
jgi:FtsP/CotA-like multicopper oxidase with cupredoxin domain